MTHPIPYQHYELALNGFDGSTDKTDHLIVWITVADNLVGKLIALAEQHRAVIYKLNYPVDSVNYDYIISTESDFSAIGW